MPDHAPCLVATLTGPVDLAAPDPALITPAAIAHRLARINRWGGATLVPYSVAQHSLLVAQIVRRRHPPRRDLVLHALLHDAHEYLVGDIIAPVERRLAQLDVPVLPPGTIGAVALLKRQVDHAIFSALGIDPPHERDRFDIDQADMIARAIEWSLLPPANGPCPYGTPPTGLPRSIKPLAWPEAEARYLADLTRELAERDRERAA